MWRAERQGNFDRASSSSFLVALEVMLLNNSSSVHADLIYSIPVSGGDLAVQKKIVTLCGHEST
jgi:hypothetical protein